MFLLINAHRWVPSSPPAALEYVAWELEKMEKSCRIVDIAFTDEGELRSFLQENEYEGICLTIRNLERTMFSDPLHFPLPAMRGLVQLLRQFCSCPIIVGGSGFSIIPEKILEYLGADYGIKGGGEEALPLLVRALEAGKDLADIPHLVYRKDGIVSCNPGFPYERKLLPIKRGYFNYHAYFRPGHENFHGFGSVETKRGCPHRCVYCVEPEIKGRQVRVKAPEDVIGEVEWFLQDRISHFFLADSEFNTDAEAAVALCTFLREEGYAERMKWIAYTTPSNFPDELAQVLPHSGNLSTMVDFGHVTGRMLSALGKNYTSSHIEKVISSCEEYKVNFRGSLMLGGPGEDDESVREAIDFFKGKNCKVFIVVGIRVFPHTPLGEKIQREGLQDNPNLYGKVVDNDDLFEPVYYISSALRDDIFSLIERLTCGSGQFYITTPPFTLRKDMQGPFRGVTPRYETTGVFAPQCVGSLLEGSSIFNESEGVACQTISSCFKGTSGSSPKKTSPH